MAIWWESESEAINLRPSVPRMIHEGRQEFESPIAISAWTLSPVYTKTWLWYLKILAIKLRLVAFQAAILKKVVPNLAGSLKMKRSTLQRYLYFDGFIQPEDFSSRIVQTRKELLSSFRSSKCSFFIIKKADTCWTHLKNTFFLQIIRNEARRTKPAKHTSNLSCPHGNSPESKFKPTKEWLDSSSFLCDSLSNLVGPSLDGFSCLCLLDWMLLFILLLRR